MNKKTIATFAAASLALIGGIYLAGSEYATLNQPQFNSYDKKKLKKAYRIVFRKTLAGKYTFEGDEPTDAELNILLHREYEAL